MTNFIHYMSFKIIISFKKNPPPKDTDEHILEWMLPKKRETHARLERRGTVIKLREERNLLY
jgi:hypothetical protein